MVLELINTILYPLYCQIFVFWFDMGMYGVVVVKALSEVLYILALIGYIKYSHCCDNSLTRPTMDVFKGWGQYLGLAFPSLLMTCLEWWGFEIMNLLTGRIGVVDLGANVIAFNYVNFIYLACIGIGTASCTLVGNSIGEDNIKNAKRYTSTGIIMTVLIICFIDLLVYLLRFPLSRLFSKNEEVIVILENLLYMIMVQEIFDGLQGTMGKILIAMGRQKYASWINLFSYYVIMLPIGSIAAFIFGWRVYGMWFGSILATCFVALGFGFIIYREDWKNLKKDSIEADSTSSST